MMNSLSKVILLLFITTIVVQSDGTSSLRGMITEEHEERVLTVDIHDGYCADDEDFKFRKSKCGKDVCPKSTNCAWLSKGKKPAKRTKKWCEKKWSVRHYCRETCGAC